MTSAHAENDLLLPEGVCFGWFSSVNAKCQTGSCMQSARCQQYTVTMQQTSGMLDMTPKAAVERRAEEKPSTKTDEATQNTPDECVQRAYLDSVVACLVKEMNQDEVHYDPMHIWATIKKNRTVIAFVIRNKKLIRVRLGASKEPNRPEIELPIGMDIEAMKAKATAFIKKHT
jgi:hypothetical protein